MNNISLYEINMKRTILFTIQSLVALAVYAQNPFVQSWFTSDPAPLVVGDRMYVYTGHDEDGADFFWMQEWRVYSTDDMVNWTDHGSPLALESFSWADDRAWASQCIERDGKFFWYICAHSQLSGGMAIGVAVSDKPTGPFRDAIGKPLYEDGKWDHIDPTVMIDDDGQAWLMWGNPQVYYLKLNRDMISYEGTVGMLPMTEEAFGSPVMSKREKGKQYKDSYVEGPWLMKAPVTSRPSFPDSKYYLLYAAGGVPEHISYSTAPHPTGPWTYAGEIMPLCDTNSFTNHCGVAEFKGHNYFFYHTGKLPNGGGFGRSVAVEEFKYNADGRFPKIMPTDEGVKPVGNFDPYRRVEAETMAFSHGVKTEQNDSVGVYVTSIHNGDYIKLQNVDFGDKTPRMFTARVASGLRGGAIEIRIDSLGGQLLGRLEVPGTGGWEQWCTLTTDLTSIVRGHHDLCFVFTGRKGPKLFNFDWWEMRGLQQVNMPLSQTKYTADPVPLGDYETLKMEKIQNPMLWSDVPDPDVIRVGDTFYMVSTTMHLMPGAPIMRSKDLKNWETVGYIFDRLTDSPKYDLLQGTAYGRGQWATSLKYHNGKFYALLAPNERGAMGDTYIFSAEKAEGPWNIVSRMRHFHDCSLFFDDDGRVYVIYGTGEMMELKPDLSDVIEGTHQHIFQREPDEQGLLEGSRMIKHNGKYYLLMISHTYAPGRHRREVCYRADDIHGPYEKQVILESEFGGFSYEAQGTIVDTPEGDWYGIIFQDRGGVGRVLTVMPCRWINGWPMLGDENGKVPDIVRPLISGQPTTSIVKSDDFRETKLGLHWQWNHNPIDAAWSLTQRPGYLRLKTNRIVPNIYLAPNTLTQRMEGPTCSGAIAMDITKMKDGDCAGLAAFNSDTGALVIKKKGKRLMLEMNEMTVELSDRDKEVMKVEENTIESICLKNNKIWLRIDADFQLRERGGHDSANFYYSLDGEQWTKIGTTDYRMRFDWQRFFMGTKFAIFCYATKKSGGYVDIDAFDYSKGE